MNDGDLIWLTASSNRRFALWMVAVILIPQETFANPSLVIKYKNIYFENNFSLAKVA